MQEIYDFLWLARLYVIANLVLMTLMSLGGIWWIIKKGMLKFAFKKNDIWNLHEKVERLENRINANTEDLFLDNNRILNALIKQSIFKNGKTTKNPNQSKSRK